MRRQSNPFWFQRQTVALLSGFCTALVVMGLLKLGVWQPLENIAYTVLFQIRGPTTWDDRVVVVAIDEASLDALGRFPWSRQRYAELLDRLTDANASTVAFNLILSEPSPDDRELADAMIRQGRVVLAEAWDQQGVPLPPTDSLQQAAIVLGHISQPQTAIDGVTRNVEFQVQDIPTLGLAAVQVYSFVQEAVPLPDPAPLLWVNWSGSTAQIPTYSYAEVLQGKIPAETFQDKIVLVGVTAAGLDPLQTPFDRNPPTTSVYLHATVVNNLLQRNFLWVPDDRWVLLGLLLAGCSLSYVMAYYPAGRWTGTATLCLGWCLISGLLFQANYWIPIASPVAVFLATAVVATVIDCWRENGLLRQEVKRLWQTYHLDLVAQPIASSRALSSRALIDLPKHRLPQRSRTMLRATQLATLAEQFGRSQSAQAAIARSLSIGLIAADLDGRIWFCNPVAAIQLRTRVGDSLHRRLVPMWLTDPQWNDCLNALHDQQTIQPYELQQHDRWFELKLEPLIYRPIDASKSESPEGVLLILEDITAQKQAEENLRQQMQALEQLNQLKDDFLSTVSHELRTPMSNMKMAIHMLRLVNSEEHQKRYLQILQDECNRETELINDLLDLQRLEVSGKTITLEHIDLQTWLPQLIKPFHERTQARQQTLYLELQPDLPPITSEQNSLQRILAELINNACKYTPPQETITVEVYATSTHIHFVVSNSGTEIPDVELNKIFEKFYRVPSGDRWKQGGTGLGLALVKKLVDLLDGTIHVTSQQGQTRFTVQLPRT